MQDVKTTISDDANLTKCSEDREDRTFRLKFKNKTYFLDLDKISFVLETLCGVKPRRFEIRGLLKKCMLLDVEFLKRMQKF